MEHSERSRRGDICRCVCANYNGYICAAGHVHFELDRKRQRAHGQRLVNSNRQGGTNADPDANADPDTDRDANTDRNTNPDTEPN